GAHDAAEPDVPGRRVDGLALAGRRAIAMAVVGRTEMRPALGDGAWDQIDRVRRIVARRRVQHAWIARGTAGVVDGIGVPNTKVVGRPLPDVAGHVEEAVAVRRKRADRRCASEAVELEVLPGELALPRVGHHPAVGRELVAPGIDGPLEAAPGSELPLGLGRQVLAGPGRVRSR